MSPRGPIRIFVGSGPRNIVEERVFLYTIAKYSTSLVETCVIDGTTGSVTFGNGDVKTLPGNLIGRVGGATAFSIARYAIPQWCEYRGRAIYCDSDQVVLTDISELWDYDLAGNAVAAVPIQNATSGTHYLDTVLKGLMDSAEAYYLTSVMLIDCSETRSWDLNTIIERLDQQKYSYTEMMFLGKRFTGQFATTVKELPSEWNHLDTLRQRSKLVHFTDLTTQPWLSPCNQAGAMWEKYYCDTVDVGALSLADLDHAYGEGLISRRIRALPMLNTTVRYPINLVWRQWEDSLFVLTRSLRTNLRSAITRLKRRVRSVLAGFFGVIEATMVADYPFPSEKQDLRLHERLLILVALLRPRLFGESRTRTYELCAFIYSEAGKRMLIPLVLRLLQTPSVRERQVRVSVIVKVPVDQDVLDQLRAAGCGIGTNSFSLIKACAQPEGKVVLLCLDHRVSYEYHKLGVDVADTLRRYSVKTISMQHGGTRDDSVRGLASAASDVVLVWGQRVAREVVHKYQAAPYKFRLVGNPLHDQILSLDRERTLEDLRNKYPDVPAQVLNKKIVLLATCLHSEYRDFSDEQECYATYVNHVYGSLDSSQVFLIIKMHPSDTTHPNLYLQRLPSDLSQSTLIVPPAVNGAADIYALIHLSDLVITRASTVAEEALLMGKRVIAFDLGASGPSRHYQHLESYGMYRTVYASPESGLKDAVSEMLSAAAAGPGRHEALIQEDLTYSLDGGSTDRAVRAIVQELFD